MKLNFDVKKWIFVILAGVLAFGSVVGTYMTSSGNGAALAAQSVKINQLKNDLAVKEAVAQKNRDTVNQAVSGVDAQRKIKDDEAITNLLRTALTWDSYQSYMDARTKLMTGFGIKEDSDFLTKVMPAVPNKTDPSGKAFNVIDTQGLNSSFSSVETRISMIKVTDYSYFGIVAAHTKSNVASNNVDVYYAVSYTYDANGKLLSLKIDSVPEAPSTT